MSFCNIEEPLVMENSFLKDTFRKSAWGGEGVEWGELQLQEENSHNTVVADSSSSSLAATPSGPGLKLTLMGKSYFS